MNKKLIFIVVDDMRKDSMEIVSSTNMQSGFKKFAESGTSFSQLITHAPETFLSVGTHLTGLYPFRHKSGCDKFTDIYSMFDYLRPTHKLFMQAYYPPFGQSYTSDEYEKNFGWIGKDISRETMGLNPDISRTIQFLTWNKDKESFVYLHFFTLRFLEDLLKNKIDFLCENGRAQEVITAYHQAIAQVDEQIFRLWDVIKDNSDEYLVVITSDHGESFKLYDNHVLGDSGAAWMLHNGTRYEESINIPMIVCGTGVPKSIVINKQIRQIDIFPTLLKTLDIPLQKKIDGDAIIFDDAQIIEKPIFICRTSETLKRALRTQDGYKLIFSLDSVELYDLKNDPNEQRDISKIMTGNTSALLKIAHEFFMQEDFTKRDIISKYCGWERLEDNWSIMKKRFRELNIDEWYDKAAKYNKIAGVSSEKYILDIISMMGLNEESYVLEVGLGTGIVSEHILDTTEHVYGVDVSPSMLERTDKRIKTYIGMADNLPFPNETFDVVFGRQIYHNLNDLLLPAIDEARRVLKKNGRFIIAEFIPADDKFVQEWINLRVNQEKRSFETFQSIIDFMRDMKFSNRTHKRDYIDCSSLNNWLDNWCGSEDTKKEIKRRFNAASAEYKSATHFIDIDNDLLFDMHYGIVSGVK